MSRKKENKSEKENLFLDRLAALSAAPDEGDESTLEDDLLACGIDPAELRKVAHDRLRRIANQDYISLGRDCPPKLREFLRQMRPPTPEEELAKQKTQAASKINDLLSSIRSGITSALTSAAPPVESMAHAFRNKKKALTQKDRDLLKAHQDEIDSESGDEKP
jgi:hypothetical protein